MELLNSRIIDLIAKRLAGIADAGEVAALEAWLAEDAGNQALLDRLTAAADWRADLATYERAVARTPETEEIVMVKVWAGKAKQRAHVQRMWGMRVAAACIVITFAGGGWWLYNHRTSNVPTPVVAARPALAPGGNRATLILADNKEIALDDARIGSLAQQGDMNVTKADSSMLEYSRDKAMSGASGLSYNTVVTPRAGQYKLRLGDGTTVYLNAQSSLRYPVAFGKGERRVELKGEGYFEVTHDAARPFKVDMGEGKEVTVLGTRFDARNYSDDPGAAATLLDGAVRVTAGERSVMLAPAERATLDPGGAVTVTRDEHAEASIAWTRGLFRFSNLPLADVMRQLSRWYDVDVVFQGVPSGVQVTASISRNTSAWQVLDALKEIAGLKYKVEGKKIVVLP